jgi:hypothetical protein
MIGLPQAVYPMKILFLTQNRSLHVFHALHESLTTRTTISRCGYVVADSWYYHNWSRAHQQFERSGHAILKEWELTAPTSPPDLALIRRYEERLREPNLLRALLIDRRLSMGPHASFAQDYRRRFSDDQLLSILQNGLVAMDRLFDTLAPDVVIGFICVTFLDYLGFLFARERKARYLNLRFARIADRMVYASSLEDPPPEFAIRYREVLAHGSPRLPEARQYLQQARESAQLYEGVFKTSHRPARKLAGLARPVQTAARQITDYWRYRRSDAAADNHVPDPLVQVFHGAVVSRLRAWRQSRALAAAYVHLRDLEGRRFAFFPLHTEPEISWMLYGRPFVNQIEAVRAFAESLPADMLLVVKEHPWKVGKRRSGYYRKLLEIPKVTLAHPGIRGADLIRRAALLTAIAGSAGLEAAVYRKPSVILGEVPFLLLPGTMVRSGSDLRQLPATVQALLASHEHSEAALEAFLATLYEQSESVHWYGTLLDRDEFKVNVRESSFEGEIQRLADFTLAHLGSRATDQNDRPAAGRALSH